METRLVAVTEEMPVVDEDLVLGRYRLGRRLGAGGFGTVHEALDERLGRWVALKVIPAEGTAPDRARREAMAAARLDHPGIVAIFDAGEEPGARYLVSELVEGDTLAALSAAGELSDRDVLRVGLALADALEHAHDNGVVHRDVKPQNVLVPDRPRNWREAAKLADFGVARLAGDDPLTATGDVVGTLAYMAPEQAAGKRVDHRADLYALALVIYEALAGHNPVRCESPAATARRVGTVLPGLRKARGDLPPDLCAAIDRALRPAPAERGDLAELADALADCLTEVADDGGTIARHPLERGGPPEVPARALSALATGGLIAAALAGLSPSPALHPALAGLCAAALTAMLPRLGWIASALGAVVLLIGPVEGSVPGSAGLVLLAIMPVPLLVRGAPAFWSLPAAAPLLAGAFPAVAGMAGRWHQRAALGALGAWWLILAEPLLDSTLLIGPADGVVSREDFEGGLSLTAAEVIAPTFSAGLPALLGVWALAATILPWIARGRSPALDFVAVTVWAATLAAGTAALATALGRPEPRGLVLGALAGGAIAAIAARKRYFAA